MKIRMIITIMALMLYLPALTPVLASTDHKNFYKEPFKTAIDVTKKCLECHENAAAGIMKTSHWTWSLKQNIPGKGIVDRGKKNVINNFCIALNSNWPRCTSCHIGYGWKDASFDFTDKTRIDCLICHDTTGTYKKNPMGAGMPMGPRPAQGLSPAKPGVDLLKVAQNVGKTSRANCGACHFFGGGGDKVKHGDLDTSMITPSRDYDVHMGTDSGNFSCQECHKTKDHSIKGNAMVVSPGGVSHIDCTDCHDRKPHKESLINSHTVSVACQTCHIPFFAKSLPTNISWDWSTAGKDIESEKDRFGMPLYHKKKGSFTWDRNIVPYYTWYNGSADAYALGDRINPDEVTLLNWPLGDIRDRKARIYPFKVHTGNQIYDSKNMYLAVPKLFGKGGFWKTYDWNKSAEAGMKTVNLPYSGEYGFAETKMYWRINHMVVPAKDALRCLDCHGDNGRLDWNALGYKGDPIKTGGRQL